MSIEATSTGSKDTHDDKVWKNPTVVAALIAAIATVATAVITILLTRESSATVATDAAEMVQANTVEPSTTSAVEVVQVDTAQPSATVGAVQIDMTEPSVIVEATAVEAVQFDSMDALVGWASYTDDRGSAVEVSGKPGRMDSAIELIFNLQDGGWVGIAKAINPGSLADSDGLAFYLRGSGEPNTIEFKLLYTLEDGTNPVFSVSWYSSSVTADWMRLEADYDQFTCWEETGCVPGEVLDPARVTRIDFAVSNKPGDVPGVGVVLLDSIEASRR